MSKIQSIDELAREIGIASQSHDLDKLNELEKCFDVSEAAGPLPLAPRIVLNPEYVKVERVHVESDQVLGLANALSRARRRIQYYRQKWLNFRRPVIVSEGDSWFQYPIRLDDIIDVLMEDYLLLSLGAAGDLLTDMSAQAEYEEAIADEDADIFLVSGGGNDMLHSRRLTQYLRQYEDGMDAEALLRRNRWDQFRDELKTSYAGIFDSVTNRFPHVTILCHGYDYAIPRPDGRWLGGPLAGRGVPEGLWNDVVKILIDEFNESLIELAGSYRGRVIHIDCRGKVGTTAASWFDELHPKDAGYKRCAKLFSDKIEEVIQERGPLTEMAPPAPATSGRPTGEDISNPVLPMSVTNQFVAHTRDIARPSPTLGSTEPVAVTLDEAIIDTRRPNVGPPLRKAPPVIETGTPPAAEDSPERVSAVIRSVRDSVLEQRRMPESAGYAADEAADGEPSDEDLRRQPPCSSLAAWRAHLRSDPVAIQSYNDFVDVRREYEEAESEERIETRMELLPENDLFLKERIIGRSNLEQINFLSRGQRAARTVGRISVMTEYGIPAGTGSGFLVGPGLLLTNNHVISSRGRAGSGSYVLFDYEYDADNRLKNSERFDLTDELFITDETLDFTLVSVAPVGNRGSRIEEYGRMRLVRESGKALKGEKVSIIQHPEGLPKQIAIRDSTLVGRKGAYVYYYADTNRGSSGSPVVNDQWFPVALHHRSVPDYHNKCHYVANRGIRISEIYKMLERAADAGNQMASDIIDRLETHPPLEGTTSAIPSAGVGLPVERMVEPFHELPYDDREGYDQWFLGRRVPMPFVKNASQIAAPRIDNSDAKYLLNYEHFSLVMHKHRRLAIFTAANVDASSERKRPERGKKYGRKALAGLGNNDREKWFEDPRISSSHQLPDKFFDRDDGAFDKGHLTMRAEVAWGDTYQELRRANGDTYHTTNCSPQVAEFNRAVFGFSGLWGELESIVLDEADDERLCVFAGPVLSDSDREFRGRDDSGEVLVKIPKAYWKVIVARKGNGIETFAFILEQDLSDVPLEFAVSGEWKRRRTTIDELEDRNPLISFPSEMHASDS